MRNAIAQRGLVLVGWYHSHPSYQPDPSLQDIQNQLKYQKILQHETSSYGPCLGMIVCKYKCTCTTRDTLLQNPREGCCKGSAVRIYKGKQVKWENKKAKTKQKNGRRLWLCQDLNLHSANLLLANNKLAQ